MKVTVKQLKQLIREQVEEMAGGGFQREDLMELADAAHAALEELHKKMMERKESLSRNGDGERSLDRAISQVDLVIASLDNIEYLQNRESKGSTFSGEPIYSAVKRRNR